MQVIFQQDDFIILRRTVIILKVIFDVTYSLYKTNTQKFSTTLVIISILIRKDNLSSIDGHMAWCRTTKCGLNTYWTNKTVLK